MIFFIALNFGAKYLLCHFIFSGKRMIHTTLRSVFVYLADGAYVLERLGERQAGKRIKEERRRERNKKNEGNKKKMSELVIRSESKVSPTLGRASS